MIADIESGKINCVITKDLSRLGRNYLETGVFIEVYFPEHNVRYIAINDVVDTSRQESADFTPFRNIINELYAKDTSKKVRSAKRARVLDGMYVATSAPYGYKKDEYDRHRLVIDERYAPTVRFIFSLAKDGKGISQIRSDLNERHILRPSAVNPNGYERYFDGENDQRRYEWSNNSVRGILRNPVYAGHLVMNKRISPSFKSHKRLSVLPENYTVVKNVHEPIVSPKDFELVQRLITNRRNVQNKPRKFENIFAGLIKCADCGYAMTLAKAHRSPKEEIIDEYGYMCNNYKTFGKSVDVYRFPKCFIIVAHIAVLVNDFLFGTSVRFCQCHCITAVGAFNQSCENVFKLSRLVLHVAPVCDQTLYKLKIFWTDNRLMYILYHCVILWQHAQSLMALKGRRYALVHDEMTCVNGIA